MYGEHLKELRERKNISQEQVARELNISRQAISKWENNKAFPDIDNLVELSNLYDVSLDELVGREKTEKQTEESGVKEGFGSKSDIISWIIIVTVICSCILPPMGVVISVLFLIKSKELKTKYWRYAVRLVCLIALIISINNCYQLFITLFGSGIADVEYLG